MEAAVFRPAGSTAGLQFLPAVLLDRNARRELIVQEANAIGTFEPFCRHPEHPQMRPLFSGVCRCQVPRL